MIRTERIKDKFLKRDEKLKSKRSEQENANYCKDCVWFRLSQARLPDFKAPDEEDEAEYFAHQEQKKGDKGACEFLPSAET